MAIEYYKGTEGNDYFEYWGSNGLKAYGYGGNDCLIGAGLIKLWLARYYHYQKRSFSSIYLQL